ncbi:MAG: glycerate kinase [Parabacteroides sp.]|nr:glycerate kinase [Parabacteroides sp.]
MSKIVIAIDSFKGCLTSTEVIQAAMEGVRQTDPSCEVVPIPISDGGEGLLSSLSPIYDIKKRILSVHGPWMEAIRGEYGISSDGKTAFIEMANVSGLPLVPKENRNPMLTTTYGTGELIHDALEQGCREFIVGIGGSATNDAGLGMLQALGFRFLDKEGNELGVGGEILGKVVHIDKSNIHPALADAHFTIACDVQNPFCGPEGAAYVFAPQKGATPEMVKILDEGMVSLSQTILSETGIDISNYPGAGAAGGLGGGFIAFLNAELKLGIQLILEALHFEEQIQGADFILTGEGKMDRQTLMGKVPFGILQAARKHRIPVIAIAGSIEDVELLNQAGFQGVFSITPQPISLEKAMEPTLAKKHIRQSVSQILALIRTAQNYIRPK